MPKLTDFKPEEIKIIEEPPRRGLKLTDFKPDEIKIS